MKIRDYVNYGNVSDNLSSGGILLEDYGDKEHFRYRVEFKNESGEITEQKFRFCEKTIIEEVVQYIIVRRDLKMSPGKLGAQIAHASLMSVIPYLESVYVKEWLNDNYTKIILQVNNFKELETIDSELRKNGLPTFMVKDICRTEIKKEVEKGTYTCIGTIPCIKSKFKDILGGYSLYR